MRRGPPAGNCQKRVTHGQQLPVATVGRAIGLLGKLCMTARPPLDEVRDGAYEWRIPGDGNASQPVRAVSSAGEHTLHTRGVTGSIPVPPTIQTASPDFQIGFLSATWSITRLLLACDAFPRKAAWPTNHTFGRNSPATMSSVATRPRPDFEVVWKAEPPTGLAWSAGQETALHCIPGAESGRTLPFLPRIGLLSLINQYTDRFSGLLPAS